MKRLLCFLLACVMVLGTVGAVEYYEVDTKYGTKTVVVPNGYTTDEVLCQIAKSYYELSGDFDILTVQYDELSEEWRGLYCEYVGIDRAVMEHIMLTAVGDLHFILRDIEKPTPEELKEIIAEVEQMVNDSEELET